MSGLCVGDRVVEVNDVNVEAMSHGEVVQQIRLDPVKAILLVVDKITDNYLKKINRPVTSSLASYTSVHEITIEEAEKLKELRLQENQQDVGENVENGVEVVVESNEENDVEKELNDSGLSNEEPDEQAEESTPMSEESPDNSQSSPVESTTTLISPEPEESVGHTALQEESDQNGSPPEDPDYAILESPQPEKRPITESLEEPEALESHPQSVADEDEEPVAPNDSPPEPDIAIEQKFSVLEGKTSATKQQPPVSPVKVEGNTAKESKKDSFKKMFMKTPKRKEVKQNSSDWKSKLNEFNNL